MGHDVEFLRLHYADTLKARRQRFLANGQKFAALLGERFCWMWEYYLTGSEATFRHGDHLVFQLQLAKKRDVVPLTRDYIVDCERDPSCKVNRARPLNVA